MDLSKARANLWKAQERLGVKPNLSVVINGDFMFSMRSECYVHHPQSIPEPYLKCTMKPDVLRRILSRELVWNNAELACDILYDRRPNTYMPDVHTLLNFFCLPGG